MANTYSQILLQFIITVKHREAMISPSWETELYKYITGIITRKDQKLIAINGMPDHLHILVGMKADMKPSDLMMEIKKCTNAFIKEKKFTKFPFYWQEGYGVFSYSRWDLEKVRNYVMNQKQHHAKKTFKDEYLELLKEFEIEFKNEYLFEFLD